MPLRFPASYPPSSPARITAPWGRALLGGLSGLVLALVFFAPASWLAVALAAASEQRLQLVEARGTVWTGSARLMLAGGVGQP